MATAGIGLAVTVAALPQAIVLLGPPGSGKDTQASALRSEFGYDQLVTGELLREEMAQKSAIGQKIGQVMAEGSLVPADLTRQVLEKALEQKKATLAKTGMIFNSYPRDAAQLADAEEIFDQFRLRPAVAVTLEVPDEALVTRLLARGRSDDTEEVIRRRLAVYRQETAPVVDYFRKKDSLIIVDGSPAVPQVTENLLAAMRKWQP